MKFLLFLPVFFLMVGCASAPKPAECKGEFKPINGADKKSAELNISNKVVRCYEGDLHGNKG